MQTRFLAVIALCLLAGCGAKKTVRLAPGLQMDVLLMSGLTEAKAMVQSFTIERGDTTFRFDGLVEVEPGRLAMVGLTPVGTRGFAAVWENGVYSFERLPYYRLPVPPRELLLMHQLAFLPKTLVLESLPAGVTLEEADGKRRLNRGDERLVVISYSQGADLPQTAILEHKNYRVTMVTRDIQMLDDE